MAFFIPIMQPLLQTCVGGPTGRRSTKPEVRNILVATPSSFHDFLDRQKFSYDQVQYFTLIKADRMLNMGFKDDIVKIVRNAKMQSKGLRRTMMFSTTFPDKIQKMAFEFLADDYLFLAMARLGGAFKDVSQKFEQVEQYDKREKLLNIFRESSEGTIRKTFEEPGSHRPPTLLPVGLWSRTIQSCARSRAASCKLRAASYKMQTASRPASFERSCRAVPGGTRQPPAAGPSASRPMVQDYAELRRAAQSLK